MRNKKLPPLEDFYYGGETKRKTSNQKNMKITEAGFKHFILRDRNVLNDNYLSELSASYFYELITGVLPCELNCSNYKLELVDFFYKNKDKYDFQLLSLYKYKKESWGDFDTDNFVSDEKKVWFYSPLKNMVIRLNIEPSSVELVIASQDLNQVQNFLNEIKDFVYTKTENKIGIINSSESGRLTITKVSIDPVKVDIGLNYGEEFKNVHNTIVKKLNNKAQGLYLLHSTPGNGKSFYIKYLSQVVTNRLFIYVPTSMVDAIVQPSLISLLLSYPDSILIIEDAEQAIISREDAPGNASLVSNILNISDGILGSILNVALILTFNTNRTSIDEALLRKGRLQAEWEFKELSLEHAKKLALSLGKDENKITGPTKLCDIYNMEEVNFHKEKEERQVGFGR